MQSIVVRLLNKVGKTRVGERISDCRRTKAIRAAADVERDNFGCLAGRIEDGAASKTAERRWRVEMRRLVAMASGRL